MRILTTAFVAAMVTTSASAMDLPVTGLALNTDVVATHKVDAETSTVTINPELAYAPFFLNGAELTAGTTLSAWDNADGITLMDEFDTLPTVDFGATYVPAMAPNVELELGTSYDLETKERSEITMTATFSF